MHYQQNFKSRSDAHLLKWMNTVETAVDQLFYCQSSAKAQKKSNILFWNQPSWISWKQICPKRKQCWDKEGQIKMLLRSTRCTLVCSSTLNRLLTHNKYLTIKVRWKSFMRYPLEVQAHLIEKCQSKRVMFLFSFWSSTCTGDPAGLQPPPLSAPSFGKEGKQIWFQFGADCNLSVTLALKTWNFVSKEIS